MNLKYPVGPDRIDSLALRSETPVIWSAATNVLWNFASFLRL